MVQLWFLPSILKKRIGREGIRTVSIYSEAIHKNPGKTVFLTAVTIRPMFFLWRRDLNACLVSEERAAQTIHT